jgi:acetyl esterase
MRSVVLGLDPGICSTEQGESPMTTYEYTIQDVEYLRHGDRRFMARLFKPQGAGPFPAVIELHGGAWCNGDLNECQIYAEGFARAGLAVASIDFRHASDGYPTSLADINYAIRWVKAHAADLNTRADLIGVAGQSSGGHLAMLAAMRPNDPRYASIPGFDPKIDATVRAVAMLWPVINPLSRYRHALRARDSANPPAWVGNIPQRHDQYWKTEANMAEGNPVLILERGEKVVMPPAIWIQGRPDIVHDYRDPESPIDANEPERFTANYRKAGGEIELLYVDNATKAGAPSYEPAAAFFHKHIKA